MSYKIPFCFLIGSLHSEIELPCIFGDHMVLQRGKPIPVRGWSEEGQEVKVSFAGKESFCKSLRRQSLASPPARH